MTASQDTGSWVIAEMITVLNAYDGTLEGEYWEGGGWEMEIRFPDLDSASSFVSMLRSPADARILYGTNSFTDPVTIRLPYSDWHSLFPNFVINSEVT